MGVTNYLLTGMILQEVKSELRDSHTFAEIPSEIISEQYTLGLHPTQNAIVTTRIIPFLDLFSRES